MMGFYRLFTLRKIHTSVHECNRRKSKLKHTLPGGKVSPAEITSMLYWGQRMFYRAVRHTHLAATMLCTVDFVRPVA